MLTGGPRRRSLVCYSTFGSLGSLSVGRRSSSLNDSDRRVRCDQEITAGKNPTSPAFVCRRSQLAAAVSPHFSQHSSADSVHDHGEKDGKEEAAIC